MAKLTPAENIVIARAGLAKLTDYSFPRRGADFGPLLELLKAIVDALEIINDPTKL